jgi:hypothetical protein
MVEQKNLAYFPGKVFSVYSKTCKYEQAFTPRWRPVTYYKSLYETSLGQIVKLVLIVVCGEDFIFDTRGHYYKTLIFCNSRVIPSFCAIKQYYDNNYLGIEVNCSGITKKMPTSAVIYQGILILEIIRFKLP